MEEQLKQRVQALETALETEQGQYQAQIANLRRDGQAQVNEAYTKGYTTRRDEEVIKDLQLKDNMRKGMDAIKLELRMQGCSSKIRPFGGENSEKFQAWTQDMERSLAQLGNDSTRARTLALQTLVGPAADFATREIRSNPEISWDELRTKLDARYNDMADLAYARQKLRRMTQSRSESVQNYFERLMVHARHAYGDAQLRDRFVQQQLVEIFLDGMLDDHMVRRLIRSKPATLDRALELATSEQQAKKAFDLRRGHNPEEEEDMNVDAITSMPTDPKNWY